MLEIGDRRVLGLDRLLKRVDLDLERPDLRAAGHQDELVELGAQLLQLVLLPLYLHVAVLDLRLALGDNLQGGPKK